MTEGTAVVSATVKVSERDARPEMASAPGSVPVAAIATTADSALIVGVVVAAVAGFALATVATAVSTGRARDANHGIDAGAAAVCCRAALAYR